ncbi:Sapep family Mn(2+)-dependent dipeptidase [Enterococcus sp. LJL98]
MKQKNFKALIEAHKEEFYQDLAQIIEIPSVKGSPEIGAPYGIENKRVLKKVMEIAESYGFKAHLVDDAVAYIQLGEGEDYLGIAGHLDVVEAGGQWTYPPFELTRANGKLYGRGILDNKGPIFSCLYGLKLLMDQGYQLNKTLRILFGSDEESGSSDIARYLKQEKAPSFAFTPDCKYPVVYGERGIINVTFETALSSDALALVSSIEGEQDRSFVPDELSCTLEGKTLAVKGKRAPSNAPDLGSNAITLLAGEIQSSTTNSELKEYFSWLYECLHEKHLGQGLEMAWSDEMSGALNVTPYLLEKTSSGFKLGLSLRYPVSFTEEQIMTGLKKVANEATKVTLIRSMPSLLTDKNRPEVAQLTKAYDYVTGLDSTPVTTTGATYARFLPNTVAFGPSFPGQKGIAHNVDEYMDESDLLLNMEIYMHAILNLCE